MRVSVVIPTFNRVYHLEKCLEALEDQDLSGDAYEVIVVDDGSTDDTLSLLEHASRAGSGRIRYLVQENAGPAAARNRGLQHASGTFVAFTDDDCVPERTWLRSFLESVPDRTDWAGVGGRVIRIRDTLISRYIDYAGPMQPGTARDGTVTYLVTANAMYRRDLLEEVGGFHPRLSCGEDSELSGRLRDKGYTLTSCEHAVVRHHHRDSISGLYKTFWCYGLGSATNLDPAKRPRLKSSLVTLLRRTRDLLLRERLASPVERLTFSALCWVHLIAFWRGRSASRTLQDDGLLNARVIRSSTVTSGVGS